MNSVKRELAIPIPALIGHKTWREERTININDAIKALIAAINAERDKQNNGIRASVNKTYTYYMQQLNKLIVENKALWNENDTLKVENTEVKLRISQLDENAVRRVTAQKDAVIERLNTQLTSKNEDIKKLKTDYNTLWEKYKILVLQWNDLTKQPEIIEAFKRVEERKRKKREEQAKKRYRKKPANAVRLCADDIMTRLKLKSYQDSYAVAMAKYGLQRGIDGSQARHKSTLQYYRNIQKLAGSLKSEVVDLQKQKTEAEQELRRAKKEVQTEKLKGAATTAATHIAESVGSLFGSNKVRTLERRNEDLQDRILELEEEARQREQQQAKHIQEITDAYEQRHRKLSEFVDFVKCYFPYVEKLMPTIKFLRDTLNFGDALIRKLCTFKDVSIKGEFYSREFNQHFRVDKTICSLKENKEGNFNLHIDGVSHVSWFRRKKEEFMERLRPQARSHKRGIKL